MIRENFEFLNVFSIKEISYKDNYPVLQDPEELKITDEINFEYKESKLKISVTRKVWFEPISLFDIKINIETFLKEKESFDYDLEALSYEEFIENFEAPISSVCAKISTIISTITMFSNDAPLVTPPSLISNTDNE